ncbi:RHS repeat domain-containing protein [Actinomyces faecalis]|nr:RHS repeat domain-containing protein [Actinomyces faecalis]
MTNVMCDESGQVTGTQPREGPTDEYTYDEAGRLTAVHA